jgi:hypothetical protein
MGLANSKPPRAMSSILRPKNNVLRSAMSKSDRFDAAMILA